MNLKKHQVFAVMRFFLELLLFSMYILPEVNSVHFKSVSIIPEDDGGEPNSVSVDNGYGSRVQTSDTIAKETLLRRFVYGADGPGRRRRGIDMLEKIIETAKGLSLLENNKRHANGNKIQNHSTERMLHDVIALESISTSDTPGKSSDVQRQKLSKNLPENIRMTENFKSNNKQNTKFQNRHEEKEKKNIEVWKRRRVTDGGYGSRVILYSNMANHTLSALNNIKDLYGHYGPGKR